MGKGSLGASTFKAGGAYEGPIKIGVGSHFGKFDFGGKVKPKATVLAMSWEYPNKDGEIEKRAQYMGMGNGWEPSEDGDTVSDNGEGQSIISETETNVWSESEMAIFLASLEAKRGEPLTAPEELDGLCLDVERLPVEPTEKQIKAAATAKPPKPAPKTQWRYVVKAVLDGVPWEQAGNAKKKAAAPKPEPEVEEEAEEVEPEVNRAVCLEVMGTVMEAAGKKGLKVADLAKAVGDAIKAEHRGLLSVKPKVAEMCASDKFLAKANEVFEYDGDTGKLTPA